MPRDHGSGRGQVVRANLWIARWWCGGCPRQSCTKRSHVIIHQWLMHIHQFILVGIAYKWSFIFHTSQLSYN